MILRTFYDGDPEPTVVARNPSHLEVAETVCSMDWNRFAFVSLLRDDDNWLDGSGCMAPGFGLSMMLSVDGVQYVTENAPPTPNAMLATFNAYLDGEDELLFSLIYNARGRGLSADDVAKLRREEYVAQRKRTLQQMLAEAARLFSAKDYTGFIKKLEPFEALLGRVDAKKLSIARERVQKQRTQPGHSS